LGAVLLVFGAVALAESVVVVALRRWRPRASEGKLSRRVAGGLVLVVTPLVVLTAYARLAPLPSPYALVEQPGFVVLDAEGVVLQRDTTETRNVALIYSFVEIAVASQSRAIRIERKNELSFAVTVSAKGGSTLVKDVLPQSFPRHGLPLSFRNFSNPQTQQ